MSGWWMALPQAVQGLGTLRQGQEDAATYRMQAQATRDQARVDEEAQRRQGRQVIGAQAAAMAEAGGGVDEKVMQQSSVAAELDALNIRYGGQLESAGLLRAAKSAKKQSRLLAGAQLLSGATSAYAYSRNGP